MIYTDSHASLCKSMAGKKYQPSNGTEGEWFFESWCRHCERDAAMNSGANLDDCDDDQKCDIIARSMAYSTNDAEYPSEWIYGQDGQPRCTAFSPVGEPLPTPRCAHTIDMFDGGAV